MAQTVSLNVGDLSGMDMNAFFRNRDLVHAAVSSLNDGFQTMRERAAGAGRAVGRMVKDLEGVVSALMHVSSVEEGLDAGMMNLYRWSRLFSRGFSNALDLLATDALYLKNSLAAMAAPLMQAVAPAVNVVADRFAGLFNIVNQTVARLSGASSYVAAKKTADAWNSVGGRITRAASAVRRFVAGFDQLNILYAGSGDSRALDNKVASMFEERPIESGLAAFADSIRAAFESADWRRLGGLLGEKVNEFVASVDWTGVGRKVGFYLGGAIETAGQFLETVRFDSVGARIADFLNGALAQIDFSAAGATVALFFTSAVEAFAGFARRFDWGQFAAGAADAVNGFVRKLGEKLDAVDWAAVAARLTEGLNTFIRRTDWIELGRSLAGRVNDLFAIVGTAAARFDWSEAGRSLSNGVNGFLQRIDWAGIGRWFDRTVKGVLDFALAFLKGFDAKDFAKSVEKALGEVDWKGISAKLWELMAAALSTLDDMGGVGTLLSSLFGGSTQAGKGLPWLWRSLQGGPTPSLSVGVDYVPNAPDGEAYKNGDALRWLQKTFEPGVDTQSRVELTREGWRTVSDWVQGLTGKKVSKAVGLIGKGWKTVAAWVQSLTGEDVDKSVGLVRRGFQTVAAWVQSLTGGNVDKDVGLVRRGFQTVAAWVQGLSGGNVDKGVGLIRRGFETVAAWVQGLTGGNVDKGVGLVRRGFDTVAAWVQSLTGGNVDKGVGLIRRGFDTVASWVQGLTGGNVDKAVGLTQQGWQTVQMWITTTQMGGAVNKEIGLERNGWWSVAGWILDYMMGGEVIKGIGLDSSGWWSVAGWIMDYMMGGEVVKGIGIESSGWWSVAGWITDYMMGDNVVQPVDLTNRGSNWTKGIVDWITGGLGFVSLVVNLVAGAVKGFQALFGGGQAGGGVVTAGGSVRGFASGGVIRGGAARWWNGIPKYAAGTGRAHGTLFAAGEAGPEIVGHINGRTEILNKSQLAQTMYSAVTSGMMAALKAVEFKMPAMATGSVMPYAVSAQIAKSSADIQGTLDANNEDLIQTIISVAGQIVAAVNGLKAQQRQGAPGGMSAQQIINEINRRTQMFGASPLQGV